MIIKNNFFFILFKKRPHNAATTMMMAFPLSSSPERRAGQEIRNILLNLTNLSLNDYYSFSSGYSSSTASGGGTHSHSSVTPSQIEEASKLATSLSPTLANPDMDLAFSPPQRSANPLAFDKSFHSINGIQEWAPNLGAELGLLTFSPPPRDFSS